MATYIITAFSFLAANFGWFGGAAQTEIFFWADLIMYAVLILICGIIMFVLGSDGGGFANIVFGGAASLITIVLFALAPALCVLAAWICTFLWEIDFFLAFQIMAIGSATAGLFSSKKDD